MNKEHIEKILNSGYIVKAYKTPDNEFLLVENKKGGVFTIWGKDDGFQMSTPIKPNKITGSAVVVLGFDIWDYGTMENVLDILENKGLEYPSFFDRKYIDNSKFITIEQSAEIYNNIMGYEKIEILNNNQ